MLIPDVVNTETDRGISQVACEACLLKEEYEDQCLQT